MKNAYACYPASPKIDIRAGNATATCDSLDIKHNMILYFTAIDPADAAAALMMAYKRGWLSSQHFVLYNVVLMNADMAELGDVRCCVNLSLWCVGRVSPSPSTHPHYATLSDDELLVRHRGRSGICTSPITAPAPDVPTLMSRSSLPFLSLTLARLQAAQRPPRRLGWPL